MMFIVCERGDFWATVALVVTDDVDGLIAGGRELNCRGKYF